jgi:hypothetical protein
MPALVSPRSSAGPPHFSRASVRSRSGSPTCWQLLLIRSSTGLARCGTDDKPPPLRMSTTEPLGWGSTCLHTDRNPMIRHCRQCARRFRSANLGRPPKFCGVECRAAARGGERPARRQKAKPAAAPRAPRPRCLQCGKAYQLARRGRPRKFCTRACRAKSYRQSPGITFRDQSDGDRVDRSGACRGSRSNLGPRVGVSAEISRRLCWVPSTLSRQPLGTCRPGISPPLRSTNGLPTDLRRQWQSRSLQGRHTSAALDRRSSFESPPSVRGQILVGGCLQVCRNLSPT